MFENYLHVEAAGHLLNNPHQEVFRKRPDDYLTFWVLKGRGIVEAENQTVEARAGHLITLVPGKAHAYRAIPEDPWDILWIHFSGNLAPLFTKKLRAFGRVDVDMGFDEEIQDRWFELIVSHATTSSSFKLRVDTCLSSLLGLMVHRLQLKRQAPNLTSTFDAHRLQTYIHHHLAKPITLQALAKQTHLSVPHFNRVFRKLFSTSPMQYVLQKRIAQAASLLTETSMQLKEVGFSVGCEDPYYFSRLFKKIMKVSPSQFRQEQRKQNV